MMSRHRIIAPQPGEEAVPGVLGIEVRVADVDRVQRHRPGIAMCLGFEVDGGPHRGDDVVHWVFLLTRSRRQRAFNVAEITPRPLDPLAACRLRGPELYLP